MVTVKEINQNNTYENESKYEGLHENTFINKTNKSMLTNSFYMHTNKPEMKNGALPDKEKRCTC